ncbi:MAG: helix-turn-helix domain-containing protein [Chloroflexota bacterium]
MSNHSEWVSLRHAAEILGVHPATVRNWADKGDLPSRRTPGGHRRFRRSDLQKLAATQQATDTQHGEVQLILQNALGQARMHLSRDNLEVQPWYAAMSGTTRGTLREQGRAVLEAMRTYMDSGDSDANLATAVKLGKDYAARLHEDALTLPQAMRGFFYFSDFVLDSVLKLSEVSAMRDQNEWAKLLRQVNDFNNAMLLSIVEYYDAMLEHSEDE